MKRWTAWQNWVAVAAGIYTVLAMTWTEAVGSSDAYMLTGGVALIVIGVINLAAPGMPVAEWIQLAVALLVVAAPWLGNYAADMPGVAWNTWIPGVVALVASAMAIQPAMRAYHEHHPIGSH